MGIVFFGKPATPMRQVFFVIFEILGVNRP